MSFLTPGAAGAVLVVGGSTITPSAIGTVPLTIQGISSQTADMLDIFSAAAATLFSVDKSGNVTAAGNVTVSGNVLTTKLGLNGQLSPNGYLDFGGLTSHNIITLYSGGAGGSYGFGIGTATIECYCPTASGPYNFKLGTYDGVSTFTPAHTFIMGGTGVGNYTATGVVQANSGFNYNGSAGSGAAGGTVVTTSTATTTITLRGGIVTAYSQGSDARLKKDIDEYTDGLNVLMQVTPRTYKWNELGMVQTDRITDPAKWADREEVGFIAQEFNQVFPPSDLEDDRTGQHPDGPNGKWLTLDDSRLYAAMVNAIKELAVRVQKLEQN